MASDAFCELSTSGHIHSIMYEYLWNLLLSYKKIPSIIHSVCTCLRCLTKYKNTEWTLVWRFTNNNIPHFFVNFNYSDNQWSNYNCKINHKRCICKYIWNYLLVQSLLKLQFQFKVNSAVKSNQLSYFTNKPKYVVHFPASMQISISYLPLKLTSGKLINL